MHGCNRQSGNRERRLVRFSSHITQRGSEGCCASQFALTERLQNFPSLSVRSLFSHKQKFGGQNFLNGDNFGEKTMFQFPKIRHFEFLDWAEPNREALTGCFNGLCLLCASQFAHRLHNPFWLLCAHQFTHREAPQNW